MNFPPISYFFNLEDFEHKKIFEDLTYPWEALTRLEKYINSCQKNKKGKDIFIGKKTVIDKSARLKGPIIIGKNCQLGFQTHIRGPVIIGDSVRIGNTEVKRSILLNNVRADHFNYIGDSILGNNVSFGAGAKLANFRFDHKKIKIKYQKKKIFSHLKKLGSIIGDNSLLGCNSVLNPGVILGKNCLVYPLVNIKSNFYSSKSIIKR